jgi:hypothetical protein
MVNTLISGETAKVMQVADFLIAKERAARQKNKAIKTPSPLCHHDSVERSEGQPT